MINENLNRLKTKDINSMILFILFLLKDDPQMSTLSELAYILDKDTFITFLEYFGGMTIKIPTVKDFKLVVKCLLLHEYVNLQNLDFNKALKLLDADEFQLKDIKSMYSKLSGILTNYDFTGAGND